MHKTTLYLSDRLALAVKQTAAHSGRSEAAVMRDAIDVYTNNAARPRPKGALFYGDGAALSERVDEELEDFGED